MMNRVYTAVAFFCIYVSVTAQPYTVDTLITGMPRNVSFSFMGDDRIILTIKDSTVRVYSSSGTYLRTFWNFGDSTYPYSESGVLGVTVDPNFSNNHFVYVYYSHLNPASLRVVRFTESGNSGTNPVVIFNHIQSQSGIHYGGNLHFGVDDKLYISVGTGTANSDAQYMSTPRGKLLRINRDGSIPSDNPFFDDGNPLTGRDDRIWVLGLRNSFDFCFSPINDSLYATENGNSIDELNFITRGKNYGWPLCEGYCTPFVDSLKQPMFAANGYAPTGIMIYNGSAFPSLSGKVLFGSFNFQAVYAATLSSSLDSVVSVTPWAITGRVTSMVQHTDGYIYVMKYGFSDDGAIFRIKPPVNGISNENIVKSFNLMQNYPNPFNPLTSIKFELPGTGLVTLKIYNTLGMEIYTLVKETKQQGSYEVTWDASNFPSGVYFYELSVGGFTDRKKMVLIK
ncbi:MAG TPA: PQQ-dependent sugar dehydrogenase [Ignavibacteria bacterium]|nr:PQQ-dependent sugar dehydrogenase [Ignavibacteria bacterium]HMR00028.1 PQQ-dependent sugar dehydrogenase [Ignavibacteria bacterium]